MTERHPTMLSLAAALMLGGAALAGEASAAPFTPTSLTGMWQIDPKDFGDARKTPMSLTPDALAIREKRKKAVEAGDVIGDASKKCQPVGVPTMMANEFALEFLETPDRVTIVSEESPVVRSVYLDEQAHTQGLEPSWNGHSIGRWEGKTLVIDTVNFNDKTDLFGFVGLHSSTTHLVERFQVSADGQHLTGEMRFEDPRYLTKPYVITVHYNRLPPHSELWEYACEIGGDGWQDRFKGDAGK